MYIQAKKINALIGHLGLKQNVIAEKVGHHAVTFTKKAKEGTRYSKKSLEKISQELGIKIDFLLDESREYIEGQPIPPRRPPKKPTTPRPGPRPACRRYK